MGNIVTLQFYLYKEKTVPARGSVLSSISIICYHNYEYFLHNCIISVTRYSLQSKGLIVIQIHLGTWWCIEASSGLSSKLFKKVDIR